MSHMLFTFLCFPAIVAVRSGVKWEDLYYWFPYSEFLQESFVLAMTAAFGLLCLESVRLSFLRKQYEREDSEELMAFNRAVRLMLEDDRWAL